MSKKEITIPCIGYAIKADWYEGTSNSVLLVLPGFTSTKKRYEPLVASLATKTNHSVLILDLSGHGESPLDIDDITISEHFSEVVRAYDWIRENHPDKSIDVMGTSYGGFFGAKLVGVREVRKMILRVPANYDPREMYTPWRHLDEEKIRNVYRVDHANFEEHPVLEAAKNFKGEAYVLTHELDDVCPQSCTDPYTAAFHAKTWEAKGFVHGYSSSDVTREQMQEYEEKLAQWLNR